MQMEQIFKPLKYIGYAILMEEVPNEISLGFNISGCRHRCKSCHSPFLWEDKGEWLSPNFLPIVEQYENFISCICFLGGDHNLNELLSLCYVAKDKGLKTCIYSGCESIDIFQLFINEQALDYLKVGAYRAELGPLNNKNTNQRFYQITNRQFHDITFMFQQKYI